MRSASIVLGALLCACSSHPAPAATEPPFTATPVATFDEPWAMTFLPDGRLLVTEKDGRLLIVTCDGKKSAPLSGVPKVHYAGQAGLMDVALHHEFANNRIVHLRSSKLGVGGASGTALARSDEHTPELP